MLIIELDGAHHYQLDQLAYDARRTKYLESKGFQIIRIRNANVKTWPLKTINKLPKCKGSATRRTVAVVRSNFKQGVIKRGTKQGSSAPINGAPF
jgi:hypothetical protein